MKKNIAILVLLLSSAFLLTSCKEKKVDEPVAMKAVSALTASAENYFGNYPGARIISTEKVFEAMDANEDFLILDIRKSADYEAGHLKGAVNAPWGPAIAKALEWLPEDKPVYVNCYSGQTAGQTVAALNVAGFQAQSIKYGWKLGITKVEGYEAYTETAINMSPDASGNKINAEVKAGVSAFFNAIPETGSNIIAAAKIKEMLDAAEELTIVSIRKPEDFAKGHIESAINIPFGAGMQENFTQLPKDEKVYVYCYSGQTAGQTVGILRLLGYDAVSIKSGMGTSGTGATGWANEGLPTM